MAPTPLAGGASACSQPDTWSVAAAFDLAANGELQGAYPQIPASTGVRTIPPSVLKAVGWVESNWRQLTPQRRPLVSFDFGYGIMQITSGMAGAFGNVEGSLSPDVQSLVASDYTYNIAYGAKLLAEKWASVPQVGNGDPTAVENWYYALWAYNDWGWTDNPNNPRFSRTGTPATNPAGFPYQERVLYLVAHPPRDRDGNPLWQAIPVSLPSPRQIGRNPGRLTLSGKTHHQTPPALDAIYRPGPLGPLVPGGRQVAAVRVTNTGKQPWGTVGSTAVSLTYHLLLGHSNPWRPISPFSDGVLAFGQGIVPLPYPLLPGESLTLHPVVQAPPQPGRYRIAWDLSQASKVWFSQIGALPRVEPLVVNGPGRPEPTSTPTVTPRPTAEEDLLFVADTSIPDGTTLAPGTRFRKGWLIFNAGRAAWPGSWKLHLVSGKPFGHPTIPVPAAGPCRSVNVIVSLSAPSKPGRYTSAWQMRDAAGRRFGARLTLVVDVRPVSTPTGVATSTPISTPTPRPKTGPSPTPTPAG